MTFTPQNSVGSSPSLWIAEGTEHRTVQSVNRCSSILRKVEDIHPALTVDDPHANRCVAQGVQGVGFAFGRITTSTPSPKALKYPSQIMGSGLEWI
jgi:hypothetical protein